MRIYTCTPVAFGGGPDFFARDSGLLCRGFQAIGVESRAVMPGKRKPDDEEDLIRTEYVSLESADWWRSLEIDGVVLYAWGRPKFRNVAAAIQKAGIYLVLNLDNGGPVSPLVGLRDWLQAQWIYGGQGRDAASMRRFIKSTLRGLTVGLLLTDPFRAQHLKCGNAIACVSPGAATYIRKLCRIYGGKHLADRITVIPHAVETSFEFTGKNKLRQIVCVGRWGDRVQKRCWLLTEVIGTLVSHDCEVTVTIAGKLVPELETWHLGLKDSQRARVRLTGIIGRRELSALLDESQIFYSPSAYESFGIAAAEALCSGCSVVSGRSVCLASFDWFVSEDSGTLADSDTVTGHLGAIRNELTLWQDGKRSPDLISRTWRQRLHADRVASLALPLFQQSQCAD
jgi:hypothetical protein